LNFESSCITLVRSILFGDIITLKHHLKSVFIELLSHQELTLVKVEFISFLEWLTGANNLFNFINMISFSRTTSHKISQDITNLIGLKIAATVLESFLVNIDALFVITKFVVNLSFQMLNTIIIRVNLCHEFGCFLIFSLSMENVSLLQVEILRFIWL